MPDHPVPVLHQVVLDTPDVRGLAEFYRQLLGMAYRPGDEPPPPGRDDPLGRDWVVLRDPAGGWLLAFQHVDELPEVTWPDGPHPQMAHLDLRVPSLAAFDAGHERALGLGARLLRDRRDDPEEPLRVYADPVGHPFCLIVMTGPTASTGAPTVGTGDATDPDRPDPDRAGTDPAGDR